jgi:hypothetical protein
MGDNARTNARQPAVVPLGNRAPAAARQSATCSSSGAPAGMGASSNFDHGSSDRECAMNRAGRIWRAPVADRDASIGLRILGPNSMSGGTTKRLASKTLLCKCLHWNRTRSLAGPFWGARIAAELVLRRSPLEGPDAVGIAYLPWIGSPEVTEQARHSFARGSRRPARRRRSLLVCGAWRAADVSVSSACSPGADMDSE